MEKVYTWPSDDILKMAETRTPLYMHPSRVPFAVVFEGYLNDSYCDKTVELYSSLEAYKYNHCNAETREITRGDAGLGPIAAIARQANWHFFKYDLSNQPGAWLQTYGPGGDYMLHMDAAAGQTRKLSCVALLSDESAYSGGDLVLRVEPVELRVPRVRGTVVVFQPWLLHRVEPVSSGLRQTINLGFWGPPFR